MLNDSKVCCYFFYLEILEEIGNQYVRFEYIWASSTSSTFCEICWEFREAPTPASATTPAPFVELVTCAPDTQLHWNWEPLTRKPMKNLSETPSFFWKAGMHILGLVGFQGQSCNQWKAQIQPLEALKVISCHFTVLCFLIPSFGR